MTAPVATLIESNAFDAKNQDQSRFSPVHRGGWAFKRLVVDLLIECSRESGLLDAINNVRRMPRQARARTPVHIFQRISAARLISKDAGKKAIR